MATPTHIKWWWALLLISSYFGRTLSLYLLNTYLRTKDLDDLLVSDWVVLFNGIIDIPAAVLAFLLVRSIDARQTAKSTRMMRSAIRRIGPQETGRDATDA
jgi:hypothetical protein